MQETTKFTFIGAGNMAEALVGGMLKSQLAVPSSIMVTDVSDKRLEYFQEFFKVQAGKNNQTAAQWGTVLLLCVKPQVMDAVLSEVQSHIGPHQLLVSVAAGYPIKRIQDHVGQQIPIVRAMPNTPAVIQHGVTALSSTKGITAEQLRVAQELFGSVGKTVHVEESLMDAVTGLSGSGPAYVYLIIEALTDAGVRVGLPRTTALVLATHTVLGASKMVEETDTHPAILKDRVTSPGGTTIAGVRELEAGGLRATVIKAVEAATHRSMELGKLSSAS